MNKRVEWIDILKFICITLVIIVHWENCPRIFGRFFNPFFLSCFLFAAGYCYKPSKDFKSFLYKKFRTLFIPWLFFSNLNIVLSSIMSFQEHQSLKKEIFMNLLQIRALGDQQWFLASLFLSFIFFYFVIKKYENEKKDKKIVIVLFLITLISRYIKQYMHDMGIDYPWGNTNLPWHLEYQGTSCLLMLFGYIFKTKYEEKFDVFSKKIISYLIFPIYSILFIINENIIPICKISFTNAVFKMIIELAGIAMMIMISKKIKPNKLSLFFGQHTLSIFCIQRKFETILQVLCDKLIPNFYCYVSMNVLPGIVFSIVFSLFNLIILIVPIIIVEKLLPFIFGRKSNASLRDLL